MKKEFEVSISFYSMEGTKNGYHYWYDLKFDGKKVTNCCLNLETRNVIANFDSCFRHLFDIENSNFEDYEARFKELGFNLYYFED